MSGLCIGAAIRTETPTASIQRECGVSPRHRASDQEAICIVQRAGFVVYEPQDIRSTSVNARDVLRVRVHSPKPRPAGRPQSTYVTVDSRSGALLEVVDWTPGAPSTRIGSVGITVSAGTTAQAACGVAVGIPVTQEQARCIAGRVGLEPGTSQWEIESLPGGGEGEWSISNVTDKSGCSGRVLSISKQSGQITAAGFRVCVY